MLCNGSWCLQSSQADFPAYWDSDIISHVHQSFSCLQTSVDDVNDYNRIISKLHQPNERVHIQAGFKLAPPTRNPSTSASLARSRQFFSLTEPPYMMRVLSAASGEMASTSHLRIAAWTSWAWAVVATLPVPIALNWG